MRLEHLKILCCPNCNHTDIKLTIFQKADSDQIKDGILVCAECQSWYPVLDGVPRMLVGNLRDSYTDFATQYSRFWPENIALKPAESQMNNQEIRNNSKLQTSFGDKWCSQPYWGIAGRTKEIMRQWVLKKYGWETEERFQVAIADKQLILDVGAGLGREVINFAIANPDALVVGLELSRCVDEAARHTAHLSNVLLVQGDIMSSCFRSRIFDLVFSEGALHHTSSTQEAFFKCLSLLRPGGELACYLYRRKGPLREFADDYIRGRFTQLSYKECYEACKPLTNLGRAFSELKATITVSEDIPVLGIKAGTYDVQRFLHFHVLKMFWNDALNFEENNLVNTDWYNPIYAWRHTPDEIRSWCEEFDLDIIWFKEEEPGITLRARKPVK